MGFHTYSDNKTLKNSTMLVCRDSFGKKWFGAELMVDVPQIS